MHLITIPLPNDAQPTPSLPVAEWSLLAAIAAWLIKQTWVYFSSTDKAERDADRKLLIQLIDDLRHSNREQGKQVAEFSLRLQKLERAILLCLHELKGSDRND